MSEDTVLSVDDVMEMWNYDRENNPQRPLTEYERNIYGGTILRATKQLPYFSDAYAVLSPFVDATAETAYTDANARVGLSYWFFYALDINTRVTWITHEAMHVLNNHFVRGSSLGISNQDMNKLGDLEINTTLETVPSMVLDGLLLPQLYDLPKLKTMEIYLGLVDDDKKDQMAQDAPDAGDSSGEGEGEQSGEGSGAGSGEEQGEQSGEGEGSGAGEDAGEGSNSGSGAGSGEGSDEGSNSGSGAGSGEGAGEDSNSGSGAGGEGEDKDQDSDEGTSQEDRLRRDIENRQKSAPPGIRSCDDLTEERTQGADEADIEKVSPVSQNMARNNTKTRMIDHMNSTQTRGYGTSDDFIKNMIKLMSPPKVDWRELLRRAVSNAYSDTMIGRSHTSYKKVNRRYTQGKIIFPGVVDMIPTTMFAIDTSGSMGKNDYESLLTEIESIIQHSARSRSNMKVFSVDTTVKDVKPVRSVSEINLMGGGGTDMSVAFAYANQLSKKERPNIFILGTDGYTDWNRVIAQLTSASYKPIILVTTHGGYNTAPEQLRRMATVIDVSDDKRAERGF